MQSQYHLFSLPDDLLHSISLRELVAHPPESVDDSKLATEEPTPALHHAGQTCTICQATAFQNVDEQRAHFRSDWHRYNVKLRLSGAQSVSEVDFAQLVDGLQESISGSESSTSSSQGSTSGTDAVATLLSRAKLSKARSRSPSQSTTIARPQTALVWFHSPPSTQLGIYRAVFPADAQRLDYVSILKTMQGNHPPEGRKWALFMVAGGHFAGAIVRVTRLEDNEVVQHPTKRKLPRPKPEVQILKHKTFHRYTTRRKQGGSQSVNDNAKGKATSAGATLRRYGEQALRDDIQGLIHDWSEEINACERIWIRASTSNRRIFLEYDDAIISKGDTRLRTFPFSTRRPTQAELNRCLFELLRPKVSHLTEDVLHAQDLAYLATIKPKPQPSQSTVPLAPKVPSKPKLSKEEEATREKWSRVMEMTTKNRLEALRAFWEREGSGIGTIDSEVPEWAPVTERRHTLLHLASRSGSDAVLLWLLEDMNADPTIPIPQFQESLVPSDASDGGLSMTKRTAYDLAPTRDIRNIFRRCAASRPEAWDWLNAGRIPSILTKDMEEEQEEKKKVKRKGLKEKVKEREAKEKERDSAKSSGQDTPPNPAPEQKVKRIMGPQKLGGSSGEANGIEGLTPEMRNKIERERRARAAEARMKR